MTEKEETQLEANLSKKSTILFVGQTNSGKSSLVNELLGGSFLPTAEVPCTSRIVRLKYSEQNYLKVTFLYPVLLSTLAVLWAHDTTVDFCFLPGH